MLTDLHLQPGRAAALARPSNGLPWPTARILRVVCAALIDAVSAHRQYEQMRRLGISHETALRRALGP